MAKPIIFVVDDDLEVLRSVLRDVRREYGVRFRVLQANSGTSALEVVKKLKLRNESLALLISDQRMPEMTGVELFEQAMKIYPNTKRALFTAYADTEAAICAINQVRIHYYLMKPWDPPTEKLYPILNDLLDDWEASFRPAFEGLQIIGNRWSPVSHQIKDFLARNHVPYHWLDIETESKAQTLLECASLTDSELPIVFFPDGSHLTKPSINQVAKKVGFKTKAEKPFYDLAIIGAGPAGLAAAVYGASEGLRTVVIEKLAPGGQAGTSSRIENYLGFPVGLSGGELARRAVAQARKFQAELLTLQEAISIRIEGSYRFVTLADGTELCCHTLIIATGISYNQLKLPRIERLTGAGIYYGAAMTEALACQDEDIFVVGAGNSAGQAAMYLSKYARSVTLLVRRDSLSESMSKYLIDQIKATDNIFIKLQTQIVEVFGQNNLEAIAIINSQTNEVTTVPARALFIFIGAMPHTHWLPKAIKRDEQGFIVTGSNLMQDSKFSRFWKLEREPFLLETSIPGIFACGDVRYRSVKRVASAVGEGSIAVQFIHRYLTTL